MEYRLLRKLCSTVSVFLSVLTLALALKSIIGLLNQQSRFQELFPKGKFSTHLLLSSNWVLVGAIVTGVAISAYTLWTIYFPYGWELPKGTRKQKIFVKQILFALTLIIEFGALLTGTIVTATTGPEVSVPGLSPQRIQAALQANGECMVFREQITQIVAITIGWITWLVTIFCFALDRLDHDNTMFRPGAPLQTDFPPSTMIDFNRQTPVSISHKRDYSEYSLH